ncbi:MAG: bifunctional phosphoribosyl-AMP cyclohydrolase/phosphoribosyl-ATP diphosphatase HisIE [Eubacteriales bacterium]|nr:bifunctional phosphoribosyl-AMP cyclohydrolase/phosphoribosyl-ATP diphosphatase HisIE [Eubacteriales bacterium]
MEDMKIKFDDRGLVPAVVQDNVSKKVLMVAYMNEESLKMTLETKKATFFSRSRNELWVKGETSGNYMNVVSVDVDCDEDCLLVSVNPDGPACHTGNDTCFYRRVEDGKLTDRPKESGADILPRLQAVAEDRKKNPQEGSYTNYLFDKGEDKILKKVGEEAAEVVIAGKNRSKSEIQYEVADLLYHMTVMLVDNDMSWQDIFDELEKRR